MLEIQSQLLLKKSVQIQNVLILNTRITIPEIPSSEQIHHYESILENSVVPVQIILYDFIPLFHAWTVHPNNRGNLNLYLRLVLLADRVISISELVQEQATLITQAFKLERPEWRNRKQNFVVMPLPSGLAPATFEEFHKDPLLVVMAGSLEPRKNHLQFLDALEIIGNQNIPVRAEILGSAGWENDRILDRIHNLQAKGIDINRLGNLSDSEMRERIGKAQVLLQISEAEGFGLPIAEALAHGTRVLVSEIRPLKEWAGARVQIVKLHDASGLAEELLKILESPETSTRFIHSTTSWKDCAELLYLNT
jgi:glycosyltransferase involved in cell wall biosynthesis